jgi:hypothetical protein
MVERETTLNEVLFIGLVLNLQASAMIGLGKLTNPVTQKVERNMDQARMTIDMLGMLEEKTRGNCTDEETKTLQKALTELRMNYLDELKKDHAKLEKEEAEKETAGAEPGDAGVSEPEDAKAEEPGEVKDSSDVEEPAKTEGSSSDKAPPTPEKGASKAKGKAPKKGGKKPKAQKK